MDVAFTPQVNLHQTATPQPQTGATVEAGAVSTLQDTPDNVVTAATETDQPNIREDDASHEESRTRTDATPTLETYQNMRIDGFQTRLGFDIDTDTYYLEVLQPDTDNVIKRIPSEYLVEYLDQKFSEIVEKTSPSTAPLNRSI